MNVQYLCYFAKPLNFTSADAAVSGAVSLVRIPHNPRMYNIKLQITKNSEFIDLETDTSNGGGVYNKSARLLLVDSLYNIP